MVMKDEKSGSSYISRKRVLYSRYLSLLLTLLDRGAVGVLPLHLAGEGNEAQKDWMCPRFPAGCTVRVECSLCAWETLPGTVGGFGRQKDCAVFSRCNLMNVCRKLCSEDGQVAGLPGASSFSEQT